MRIIAICGDPDEDVSEARFVGHITVQALTDHRDRTNMISELALMNLFSLVCGTGTPSPQTHLSVPQLERVSAELAVYTAFIESVLA